MSDDEGGNANAEILPAIAVEQTKAQLGNFLALNPASNIEEVDTPDGKRIAIVNPWGDSSLVISVPTENQEFIDLMNQLRLPERFTAIWHSDTKAFEVIYTAYFLVGDQADVQSRKFVFQHTGKEYSCEFARSSDRLLRIAEYAQLVAESTTGWRNLLSFRAFVRTARADKEANDSRFGVPTSFWVRDVDWNEDEVLDLVHHLNFFMSYYDARSPTILVHFPTSGVRHAPRTRYTLDNFPSHIASLPVDLNLIYLWLASRTGDAARRFLYSYRIIEYVSFSYVERQIRDNLQRLLQAPHALANLAQITEDVILAVQDSSLHDTQKIESVVRDAVSSRLIWRELQINIDVFATRIEFDGGYVQEAITTIGKQETEFGPNDVSAFAKAIREIRNALSHGRAQKTGGVITPTAQNFERLQPWAAVIDMVAGEVMVYRKI
jgi:hypothetical protein